MTIGDKIAIPRTVAGLLGFLLTFNIYLMPWSSQSPRATDLIGVVFFVTAVVLLLMGLCMSKRLGTRMFVLGMLLVPLFGYGTFIGGLRWLSGFGWALGLTWMARDRGLRPVLFKGMILGTIGGLGVVLLQIVGLLQLTMDLGLTARDAAVDKGFLSIWRPPGMEPHVNGSAAVLSLSIPIALGLVEESRTSRMWIIVALGVVILGSALTLNRSSVVVSSITMMAWVFMANNQSIRVGWKVSIVFIAIVGLIMYGPPGGWQRWNFIENFSQSKPVEARLKTTLTAFEISLQNPFGVGDVYKSYLESQSGHTATHNAFIQLALLAGWPIVIWVLWKFVIRATSIFREGSVEGWLCFHMLGLFFFEEYFGNPLIITLTSWMLICPFTKEFLASINMVKVASGLSSKYDHETA